MAPKKKKGGGGKKKVGRKEAIDPEDLKALNVAEREIIIDMYMRMRKYQEEN
jgi:hypothetical protein